MSNAEPAELCVYCNLRPGTTDDHVPPKTLFPSPRPYNLITVPCCEVCHSATTKDDEYLRNILVIRSDVGESPSARACWPAVYRSLRRPEAAGFVRMMMANTREVELVTPAGLYVGRSGTIEIDRLRVERVLGRTVWGLFFHHFKARLPSDFVAAVYDVARLREIGRFDEVAQVVAPLRHCEEHVIGGDVFAYRFQAAPEAANTTAWVLRFYGAAEFVVITVPRALAPHPMVHGLAPILR